MRIRQVLGALPIVALGLFNVVRVEAIVSVDSSLSVLYFLLIQVRFVRALPLKMLFKLAHINRIGSVKRFILVVTHALRSLQLVQLMLDTCKSVGQLRFVTLTLTLSRVAEL